MMVVVVCMMSFPVSFGETGVSDNSRRGLCLCLGRGSVVWQCVLWCVVLFGATGVPESRALPQSAGLFDQSWSTEPLLVQTHGAGAAVLARTSRTLAAPFLDHLPNM